MTRRTLAAALAVIILASAGAAAWLALDGRTGAPPTPSPPRVAAPSRAAVFVPPVRRDQGRLVLPLTFPDGSTADLVYPPELNLAAMGVQPDVSFLRRDQPAPRFPLTFWFGQPAPDLFEGGQPLERHPTPGGGQAELWRVRATPLSVTSTPYWLVFRLPSWSVLAPVSTPAMAAEVAGGLHPRQTGRGHVVVGTLHPFALSPDPGEGGGPQLAIGDASPRPKEVDAGTRFRLITLHPSRDCRGEGISPSGTYASTCLGTARGGGALFAGIEGDPSFVRDVLAGLDASNVRITQ
jgi:hypothetical protein